MAFLEVPFVFTRTGFRARTRNEGRQLLSSKTIIRLPELDAADAPVVARCRYDGFVPTRDGDGRATWRPHGIETDYRLVGGRLVRRAVPDDMMFPGCARTGPIRWLDRREGRAALDAWTLDPSRVGEAQAQAAMDMIRATLPSGPQFPALPSPWERYRRGETAIPEESEGFARRTGDDKLERARDTQRALAGTACLVDDALYLPSMGPAWVLSLAREGVHRADAVPELGWLSTTDMACAFAMGDEAACDATGRGPTFMGEMDIVDPGACRMHPDEMAARAVARMTCDQDAATLLATHRSARGLHALADVLAMADSDRACGGQLPGALAAMSDAWDAVVPVGDPRRWRSDLARRPLERAATRAGNTPDVPGGPAP